MAELSTIARPYAQALFATAQGAGTLAADLELTASLAALMRHPEVIQLVDDPKLDANQTLDLLGALLKSPLSPTGRNFLQTVIDNGRLAALPEIARQFSQLKNDAEGVADCLIETAFPLTDAQLADLLGLMSKKFGLKLKPEIRVDASLIGGVRVSVGDHVLDTSVKSRLAQMQVALTAA